MNQKPLSKIVLAVFFASITFHLFAQTPPEKFGRIDKDDFKTTQCPIDSNAHAYFIFDYGESYFQYADTKVVSTDAPSTRKGFQLYFTRHFRIKIIDNQGFSWADIEIPLYHDLEDEEKTLQIKAYTYNLEGGKIDKTKLSKSDINTEQTSENWITEKFAMPNVKAGSIIEVEYTIKSDFYFNLREWYFQRLIPVMQSEYHVKIPEYFHFNQTQKGYFPIERFQDRKIQDVTITYVEKAVGAIIEDGSYTSTIKYFEDIFDFSASNIPSFPIEEHLKTPENYLSKIEFELDRTSFPNTPIRNYTSSWEDINENLINSFSFGKELRKSSQLDDEIVMLKASGLTGQQLIRSAFDLVKNHMAWNGQKNKYVTSSLKEAWKNKSGNAADINLNLVVLLNELGFEASPVVLSTQDHGIIHPAHPSISRFNYVIAVVKDGEQSILLDATDPQSDLDLLPVRCLNDRGRVVRDGGGEWIDLTSKTNYTIAESYVVKFDENLDMIGTDALKLSGYAAYQTAKKVKSYQSQLDYQKALEDQKTGLTIDSMTISGLDTLSHTIKIGYTFHQKGLVEKAGDMAYFSPSFDPFVSSNPFKAEQRDYPVEFNYPYTVQQIITIEIPDNYTVVEIPKPLIARLPDNSLRYIYNISQLGQKITLTLAFSINKAVFLPEEYGALRNFYMMVIDKQKELLVMQKR